MRHFHNAPPLNPDESTVSSYTLFGTYVAGTPLSRHSVCEAPVMVEPEPMPIVLPAHGIVQYMATRIASGKSRLLPCSYAKAMHV